MINNANTLFRTHIRVYGYDYAIRIQYIIIRMCIFVVRFSDTAGEKTLD